MHTYRCKHRVTALQWDGISRDAITQWHLKHTGYKPRFGYDGTISVYLYNENFHDMKPTEWLVWFHDEISGGMFSAMSDDSFRDEYEPVS